MLYWSLVLVCAQSLCHVQLFVTPWTVAHQAPLSVGFSRQEYRKGLPFPSSGDLPDVGMEPIYPVSPASQVESLPLSHQGSPYQNTMDSTPKIMPLIKVARLKIFFLLIYICPSDSQLLRPSLFFTHAKFYLNLSLKKLDNSSETCPSYPLQCECRAEDVFQIF